jgi:signal transduction histidine kinase
VKQSSASEEERWDFVGLVRQLDGQVPLAVLCVDRDGRILGAARPPRAVDRASLEGRSLDEIAGGHGAAAQLLDELTANGHAVVPFSDPLAALLGPRGYAVFVRRQPSGAVGAPQRALMPGIIDSAPDPMIALDGDLRVVWINAAARTLLECATSDKRGRPLAELFDDAADGREFTQRLAAGAIVAGSARLQGRDVELSPRAVFRDSDRPIGWVVWVRRPRVPEGVLEQTVHALAHDLRGPLSAVRGFASLLERECGAALGSTGRGYLERMRSGVDRAAELLEGLLEPGRERRYGTTPASLAPLEVLGALAAELKPRLEERGIELRLPDASEPFHADATGFYQIAFNLIQNAIQHMGDVKRPEITVSLEPDPIGMALVVSDNGRGIPIRDLGRIFDRFTSIPAHGDPESSGLGLSIVRRIADAHGGRVTVESRSGEGTSFRVAFPSPR